MHERIPIVDSGVVFAIGIWMEVETAIGMRWRGDEADFVFVWAVEQNEFPIYKRERGEKENARYEENEKQRTLHKGKHVAHV